jgi:hypothetical protein
MIIYNIHTTIINEERKQQTSLGLSNYNSETELTVLELKTAFKNKISFSSSLDIKEERLLLRGKIFENDNEIISQTRGLKYQIILN